MARPRKNAPKPNTQELSLVPVEEQPYPLPEGWKWVRLGDYGTTQYGYTAKACQNENLPKMLRITDIQEGGVNWSCVPNCEISQHDYETYALKNNDIVIARIGATTGKSFLIENVNNSVFASYLIRVRVSSKICPHFLYLFLQSSTYWNQIYELSSGIALPGVNSKKLQSMMLPLPPLDEQERIVTRIESLFAKLDEAREKAEAVLDSYETRKAAILHKAFTGELTAKWREERGISLEWKNKILSEIISESKLGLVRSKNEQGSDFSYAYLKMNNISSDGKLLMDNIVKVQANRQEIEDFKLNTGDFLFNTRNSFELVGKSTVFICAFDDIVLFNNNIMRIRFKRGIDSLYINYFFLSTQGKRQLDRFKRNTTNIAAIYAKDLNTLKIPLATYEEQQEITRILDSLLEKEQQSKEAAATVLEQIDLMKKAILAKAFRGELRY